MQTTIEGIVSDLDRTTHVSGGGDTMSRTTHISIFSLDNERVILSTICPAMIKNGDSVCVAGTRAKGQFSAIACRNLTSGWITNYHKQGCAKVMLIFFTLIGLIFTYIFPLFIFMPLFSGFFLVQLIRSSMRYKHVHEMVKRPSG
jgi:hypothetical protein